MTPISMTSPLDKLKKVRSLDEVITRGGQALSAYREQRRGGHGVPTDDEFVKLLNRSMFSGKPIIPETIWKSFFENSGHKFFLSFREPHKAIEEFRLSFGSSAERFIALAENLCDGRIDLLGLRNLYVGEEIDWHREPLSSKRSPLKHWKKFDDLDSSETGNKKVLWELNRHQHFFALGVAYWSSQDERFANLFASHIDSWMDDNPPAMGINWASSLEVGFRAMSWIWAFNFFRDSDSFTPALFLRAVKYLYLHGRHIENYLSTYYSPNTHLTGEALALYYLGTQLPFLERSAHWRKLGENILFAEISKQALTDGVYFEQSTWYQRYTADFYAHFVVLRSLWGTDEQHPAASTLEERLERVFDVLMNFTMPDGTTPLIGDDDGGRLLPLTTAASDDFRGSLAVGAVIFDRGDLRAIAGSASEDLFWLLGPDSIRLFNSLSPKSPATESTHLSKGGYCVMRDGWEPTDNAMIVDCGELGSLSGGHGHADALAIEVSLRGRSLLVDSGTYTYHESPELRDHFRSTAAHNTLEIDGVSSSEPATAFSWKTRASSKCESWISTERFDHFAGSHDGYARLADPVVHRREVLFLKNDYWIILDSAETSGDHSYRLNFHFDSSVVTGLDPKGHYVDGDDHRIFTFANNGAWQAKESWVSKNHGNRSNAPLMRYVQQGTGKQNFITFLLPVDPAMNPPTVTEIDAVGRGRAFRIDYAAYRDLFIFTEPGDDPVDINGFQTNFRFSWARFGGREKLPDEIVLIDGSHFVTDGYRVFDGDTHRFASIRRLGNDLNIKTMSGVSTAQLHRTERRQADRRKPNSDRRRQSSEDKRTTTDRKL